MTDQLDLSTSWDEAERGSPHEYADDAHTTSHGGNDPRRELAHSGRQRRARVIPGKAEAAPAVWPSKAWWAWVESTTGKPAPRHITPANFAAVANVWDGGPDTCGYIFWRRFGPQYTPAADVPVPSTLVLVCACGAQGRYAGAEKAGEPGGARAAMEALALAAGWTRGSGRTIYGGAVWCCPTHPEDARVPA